MLDPQLEVHHRVDDGGTVRAAVDIVAEKYECRRTAVGMALAPPDQVTQLLQRAVNVADGIDERRCARGRVGFRG